MITQQRKRRLKYKIQAARGRLLETQPFFALLLMYLKFVAVPGMKKMSTNGRCIYFGPDFLDKLYEHELDYILCHQIMHIMDEHIWRPFDRQGDNYHFACDILVNAQLASCGFTEERYAHLGDVWRKIPCDNEDPSRMSPEEIYARLPFDLYAFDERTRGRYLVDNDSWWDQKEDVGGTGEIILNLQEMDALVRENTEGSFKGSGSEEEEGYLKLLWQGRAALAGKSMEAFVGNHQMAGDIPDFARRVIDAQRKSVMDWKMILNNFVQEIICDYSFTPPDRRFSDTEFFLPAFHEKDFVTKEILFMADTSGSVENEDLAIIYSEIRGAIEQFDGKLMGKLGFFDAAVTPPLPFESIADLMRIVPYGGGGTNFAVIFEYIRQNCRDDLPACVVIFTDGYGRYPAEAETMGIPVLWILNNMEESPPFGKIARLPPRAEQMHF